MDRKPDFINDKGVKVWVDDLFDAQIKILGLKDYKVCLVELPDGYRTRLITKKEIPIYDNQQADAISIRLEVYGLLERDKRKKKK